jgi:hypothetical protein
VNKATGMYVHTWEQFVEIKSHKRAILPYCTRYTVFKNLATNTSQYTSIRYTVLSTLYSLCTVHSTLYPLLFSYMYCVLYTVYCVLYTAYSFLYTVYCALYTL